MKRTRKWLMAVVAAGITGTLKDDPKRLYASLNEQGFYWNSDDGKWEQNLLPADAPTDLVRIRVWAAADVVEEAAGQVVANLSGWLDLVERSEPYPCRPPKQLESRVYLTFKKGQQS